MATELTILYYTKSEAIAKLIADGELTELEIEEQLLAEDSDELQFLLQQYDDDDCVLVEGMSEEQIQECLTYWRDLREFA